MLSREALDLFRRHIERHGYIDVDDSNREAYRELERAGLRACGHSFCDGPNSIFKVTKLDFERRAELPAATAPSPGRAASPRR
jgi:hypothetical protein